MKASITGDNLIPTEFYLSQNYPNPFSGKTTIKYSLPSKTRVKLTVYNSKGEMIKNLVDEIKSAGTYEIEFELQSAGTSLAETTFFYHLEAGSYSSLKKMILMK
jgi:hypothetical protein